jgi:hypothetical protein
MEAVTAAAIQQFIQRLAERYGGAGTLYLLGGGALCLLGSPRETRDVDYAFEVAPEEVERFRAALAGVAAELQLDLEDVPIAEFMPLPPKAAERRRALGRYGQLDVYIFDPYTIALSKIARGFEADIEDVVFLLRAGVIEFAELERLFGIVLPKAPQADIDRREFRAYFEEVRRRVTPGRSEGKR